MKSFLYVYVPGFEYDSKGPLHIDAIRLDVTAGELNKDKDNKVTNSLQTYIYSTELDAKGEPNRLIPGNLVYRTVTTELLFVEGLYTGDATKSPFWTDQKKARAPHGYFYDFITTSSTDEKTHHVVGIHNTISDCKNVYNLKSQEHDGLFVVLINELNTDLVFNFTFYSRIDSSTVSSNKIKVGIPEGITPMIAGDLDTIKTFFNQEDRTDFFDKYIEIGKWTLTYNPALSGIEEGKFNAGESVPQYFNLRDWGTNDTEEERWQVPVNASFLVTDFDDKHEIYISGSKPVLAQYSYNKTKRRHEYDSTLPCNIKPYSSNIYYYRSFYEGIKSLDSFIPYSPAHLSYSNIMRCFVTWKDGSEGVKYYSQELPVNVFKVESTLPYTISYDYYITGVDLSNFDYLYKTLPSVTINNVLRDPDYGEDTQIALLAGVDMLGMWHNDDHWNIDLVFDCYNIQENNWISGKNLFHYLPSWPCPGNLLEDSYFTLAIKQLCPLNTTNITLSDSRILLWYLTGINNYYAGTVLQSLFETYYNNRTEADYSKGLYNSFYCLSVGYSFSDVQYKITNDSLLDSGEHLILLDSKLNNKISFNITLSDIKVPVTQFDGRYSGRSKPTTDSNDIINERKALTFADNWFRAKNGKMFVGIAHKYYIDLSKSFITYNNMSLHSVIPILTNNSIGYDGKSPLPVNIIPTNILDPNPEDGSSFEITRVLSSEVYYNTELIRKSSDKKNKELFDSTFCKECRFIGLLSSGIIKFKRPNNTVILLPGLYVLKMQESYQDKSDMKNRNNRLNAELKYTINSVSKSVEGLDNKWVFCVKSSQEISFDELYPRLYYLELDNKAMYNYFNVISGVGLYQVNLDSPDTNTQTLKQLYTDYKDTIHDDIEFVPVSEEHFYKQIIFPAACCAYEDVEFCAPGVNVTENPDYGNTYRTSESDDPVYHYYNFRYLPQTAVYEVVAFYKIPGGNDYKIIDSNIIYTKESLKIPSLIGKIIRL